MKKLFLSLIVCESFACAGGCSNMAQWFINHFEGKCSYLYSTESAINFACENGSATFSKDPCIVHLQAYGKVSPVYYLYARQSGFQCSLVEYDEYGMELKRIRFDNDGINPTDVYKSFKEISLK